MKERIIRLLRSKSREDISIAFELMLNSLTITEIENIFIKPDSIVTECSIGEFYPHFGIGNNRYVIHHRGATFIYKSIEIKEGPGYDWLKPHYLGEHKELKL